MDSLGEKLRKAREEKDRSLDQVSRDTLIAVRYIQALEEEDFSGFPGEPYLLGFLRNYSEYLGLDVQEQLSRYRAIKIQEQPIPMEQLLRSPVPVKKIVLGVLIPLLVLGLGGGGYYLYTHRPVKERAVSPEVRQAAEYRMDAGPLERRFYTGDSIVVPMGADSYKLTLSHLGEAVAIMTPLGPLTLDLGQEAPLDLNDDGIVELRVAVADFAKNNAAAGVLLRFESPPSVPQEEAPIPANTALAASTVIFSSPSVYPFTVQLNFQGYCMFRWEVLFERDRRDRNERYFQRGEELNIQAQNGVRIGASNAQVAKLQIIGGGRTIPVDLGGAGEVVAADIRWVRDEENRYHMVMARLE
ncbi:MAG: helix-turn-helix domain-containing protein [Treponema sp.]|jgi:cytoskeletal protein RodZ|nr:helix-turn-helix domain-containing protein [Treponema sp.]